MAKKSTEEIEEIEKIEKPTVINPLTNETVTYKYVPRITGTMMDNPKHVNAGGLSENSVWGLCLPEVGKNVYKKIFSYEEQTFLENILHLEPGKLGQYSDFWDTFTVELGKSPKVLDLSEPMAFIQDRVLLANDSYIAPSLYELNDPLKTKATYRFVRTNLRDEGLVAKKKISTKSKAYIVYGKIENDWDKLYYIAKNVDDKTISRSNSLEDLQGIVAHLIETKSDKVLTHTEDNLFDTKVLIDKALSVEVLNRTAGEIYMDKEKVVGATQRGDLNNTAIYLNLTENQELKFLIEAKANAIINKK